MRAVRLRMDTGGKSSIRKRCLGLGRNLLIKRNCATMHGLQSRVQDSLGKRVRWMGRGRDVAETYQER